MVSHLDCFFLEGWAVLSQKPSISLILSYKSSVPLQGRKQLLQVLNSKEWRAGGAPLPEARAGFLFVHFYLFSITEGITRYRSIKDPSRGKIKTGPASETGRIATRT